MRYLLVFICIPALVFAVTITVDDFNVEYGLSASYDASPGGAWDGWDPSENTWDFSGVSGGNVATIEVVNPSGQPGSASFPEAEYCEVFNNPGQDTQYSYFKIDYNAVQLGWYTTYQGYELTAVYSPQRNVFVFPMGVGDSWSSSYTYSYELMGVPVNCNETHSVSVVGEGLVKVPASGDYWWECLVLMDYATYSDNFGTNEARYVYTWAVPKGFAGLNETVAIQSNPGAAPSFTAYDNRFVVTETTATPDPQAELSVSTWGSIKTIL